VKVQLLNSSSKLLQKGHDAAVLSGRVKLASGLSMSLSVVAVVWAALSLVVAVSFWFSLLQPYWFTRRDTMTSLGVYSYCYQGDNVTVALPPPPGDGLSKHGTPGLLVTEICQVYGGPRFHFSKLPSVFWQASCVLFGSASVLASASALIATLSVCIPQRCDFTVASVTGYVQIIAGM